MSDVEALADQVAGILGRHEIPFSVREDRREYRVMRGSTAVFIGVRDSAGTLFLSLSSPVLQDIDLGDERRGKALALVNSLNCSELFARFCLYEGQAEEGTEKQGTLALEHDLLGAELQAAELVTCLDHLAAMADDLDERLEQELGGKRFETTLAERQEAVDT